MGLLTFLLNVVYVRNELLFHEKRQEKLLVEELRNKDKHRSRREAKGSQHQTIPLAVNEWMKSDACNRPHIQSQARATRAAHVSAECKT